MQRNGREVTIDGVTYLFDNETDAIGFFKCKSNGGTLEGCLKEFKGQKKSKTSSLKTAEPKYPEAAEPEYPEAAEPEYPEAAEPTYPETPEPTGIKGPRKFRK